jgi:flavin reductase (DIM6/NTAB) family NADH-FMN oxidoreductase RutF
MARVCTPVSVVTAMSGLLPHGTTVSAFASLSMQPPMVLVSLDQTSDLLRLISQTRQFGVNVLASTQADLARTFARKGGTDKFSGVIWHIDAGVPRIPEAAGFLACHASDLVDAGDHVIVLGTVLAAATAEKHPLTYHARGFGTHAPLKA